MLSHLCLALGVIRVLAQRDSNCFVQLPLDMLAYGLLFTLYSGTSFTLGSYAGSVRPSISPYMSEMCGIGNHIKSYAGFLRWAARRDVVAGVREPSRGP